MLTVSQPHPRAGVASEEEVAGAPADAIPTPPGITSCWHVAHPAAVKIATLTKIRFMTLVP